MSGKTRGDFSEKSAWFSTRITQKTREAIEAESAASGQSLSQTVEKILTLGLLLKSRSQNDPDARAVFEAIVTQIMTDRGKKEYGLS